MTSEIEDYSPSVFNTAYTRDEEDFLESSSPPLVSAEIGDLLFNDSARSNESESVLNTPQAEKMIISPFLVVHRIVEHIEAVKASLSTTTTASTTSTTTQATTMSDAMPFSPDYLDIGGEWTTTPAATSTWVPTTSSTIPTTSLPVIPHQAWDNMPARVVTSDVIPVVGMSHEDVSNQHHLY